MRLAVIGCGKMGLPLAVQAASRGIEVTGVDINEQTVGMINDGACPIDEPGVGPMLRDAVGAGKLRATTRLEEAVSGSDAVIVLVPVLLKDRRADLTAIKGVAEGIGRHMKDGALVSFETTVPVGTTRGVFAPILESGGRKAEDDFLLVFSPERVKSLCIMECLNKTPKLVGGYGPRSLSKGVHLYESILTAEVVDVGALENAEMAKIADMVYRDVNIALVNEMSRYADSIGINLNDIIPLANSSGEGHLLRPGIGVGGHCTPVYPYFLTVDARERGVTQSLTEAARRINDGQAGYAIEKLKDRIGELRGMRLLILGLGFRPGVKEDTKSPAYLVREQAEGAGAEVLLYDPLYTKEETEEMGFTYGPPAGDGHLDAIILVTAHESFFSLDWKALGARGVKAFVDGRGVFGREALESAGIAYIGIGNG